MKSQPVHYEIRVRGQLGETLLIAFPEMCSALDCGDTLLRGALADQSMLYGYLSQMEALGLELLEVRRYGCCDEPRGLDSGGGQDISRP